MVIVYVIILWVIPVFVSYSQGNAKNRAGIAYGLFLGWIGVIILALLPMLGNTGTHGECPYCKEAVRLDATACPHCQRDIEQAAHSAAPEMLEFNPAFKGGVRPAKKR